MKILNFVALLISLIFFYLAYADSEYENFEEFLKEKNKQHEYNLKQNQLEKLNKRIESSTDKDIQRWKDQQKQELFEKQRIERERQRMFMIQDINKKLPPDRQIPNQYQAPYGY